MTGKYRPTYLKIHQIAYLEQGNSRGDHTTILESLSLFKTIFKIHLGISIGDLNVTDN